MKQSEIDCQACLREGITVERKTFGPHSYSNCDLQIAMIGRASAEV